MGLRDLIEGKQRRTARWPLLVGDPQAMAVEIETFRSALGVHQSMLAAKRQQKRKISKADSDQEEKLRADLKGALDRQADLTVEVELQSLGDDEWEAALASLPEDDRDKLEIGAILAPLLAASCTDPDLQDADWWAEQLKRPTWTDGDKAAASQTLLELNVFAPRFGALGKG